MCDPAKVLASIRTFREIQAKLSRKTFLYQNLQLRIYFLKTKDYNTHELIKLLQVQLVLVLKFLMESLDCRKLQLKCYQRIRDQQKLPQ